MKKITLLITSLILLVISLFTNIKTLNVSADEATPLTAVSDFKIEGDNGYYTATFTDTNDSALVSNYLIKYYDNKGNSLGEEYISSSGAVLAELDDFISYENYGAHLVVCSNSSYYYDSENSNLAEFTYYPAMLKQDIELSNIIPYDVTFEGYEDYKNYHLDDYNFPIFGQSIPSTSSPGGYYIFKNFVTAELSSSLISNHNYYFSFYSKFNGEYSNLNEDIVLNVVFNADSINELSYSFNVDINNLENRHSLIINLDSTIKITDIMFYLTFSNSESTSIVVYNIKDIMLIDLTESYGEGKEPSVTSIDNYVSTFGKIDYVVLGSNQILGPQNLVTSCTKVLTSSEIISNYSTILDDTSIYILESNYFHNATVAGTYYATLAFKDTFGNVFNRIVNIVVKDDVAPVITLDEEDGVLTSYVSNPLTSAELLSHVIVTDNTDINLKDVVSIDASNYLANCKIPSTYTFTVEVVDTAGNIAKETFYVQVVNDLGPTIDAPTTIYKSEDIMFTLSDVLNTINSIVDQDGKNYDVFVNGELNEEFIVVVKDTFTGNANTEGTYQVVLKAVDMAERVTFHTITIKVVDDIPNLIMYNNTIFVSYDTTLSNKDIVKVLKAFGISKYDYEDSNIKFIINEYEANNYTAGQNYAVKIKYTLNGGFEKYVEFTIKVLDTKTSAIDNSFWSKVGKFFSDNWLWLVGGLAVIIALSVVSNLGTNKNRKFR